MAQYAYGRRRLRIRELLATGRVDDDTLDELASLVGSDRPLPVDAKYGDLPRMMSRDDVIRVWALDRGVVEVPLRRDRPVPEGIRELFVQAQRVARGDHLDD